MARASTLQILKIVLPLVGLSLLPLAGLVYTASASFGPKTKASSSAAAGSARKTAAKPIDDGDDEPPPALDVTTPTPKGPTVVVKPTSLLRSGGQSKAPQHALCCEKLSDMAQSATPKDKATLLAAASACSAASSFEGALKQVAGIVEGSVDVPSECAKR